MATSFPGRRVLGALKRRAKSAARRVGAPDPATAEAQATIAALRDEVEQQSTYVPIGHYYSPIARADEVEREASRIFGGDPLDLPGVDLRLDEQWALLDAMAPLYEGIPFGPEPRPGLRYSLANDWFAWTNGVMAYLLLRHLRPARYIEIGSGFSSAVALDVNEQFLGGSMHCTFVEPYPDRLHSLLRDEDYASVDIVERNVQDVDIALFDALAENDVLFIDSTHVTRVGSDVNRLVFEVLPRLRPGVVVHFHDVMAGFEYPITWAIEGRAWNEAYLLRAFLQYNRAFEILVWDSALAADDGARLEKLFPLARRDVTGSLWLRRSATGD